MQDQNYAENKTKKVAWFVSNCNAKNARLEYAKELQKHIEVDIYGRCGNLRCARRDGEQCMDILRRDYKFYLAFENSNCKDYVTEKFFVNALGQNILPIVMGASVEDYEAVAPHNSFIHVDQFESPAGLAEYLHLLDDDDKLYNQYFQWQGTGHWLKTGFFCRVCSMLHYYKVSNLISTTYEISGTRWRRDSPWRSRSLVAGRGSVPEEGAGTECVEAELTGNKVVL